MKTKPVKLNWLDRAVSVRDFHIEQVKADQYWSLKKTAETLNRSIGSVSQDILLAKWCKTHENQLRKFRSMRDALEYVRQREHEMRLE